MNKEVCLVINTPKAKRNYAEDRKTIRKACLKYKVSYITTIAGALAAVKGIESVKNGMGGVKEVFVHSKSTILLSNRCEFW